MEALELINNNQKLLTLQEVNVWSSCVFKKILRHRTRFFYVSQPGIKSQHLSFSVNYVCFIEKSRILFGKLVTTRCLDHMHCLKSQLYTDSKNVMHWTARDKCIQRDWGELLSRDGKDFYMSKLQVTFRG